MEELLQTISFSLGRSSSTDQVLQNVTDEELNTLLGQIVQSNGLDIEDLDMTKSSYIQMLVLRDIYWKLALASAPLYEITVDGLKVAKQTRFDHYFKMVKMLNTQINDMLRSNPSLYYGRIKAKTMIVNRDYVNKNLLAQLPLSRTRITVDNVDEEYSYITLKFSDVENLVNYEVMYSDYPIYDEYSQTVDKRAKSLGIFDISRLKHKVPCTHGFILVLTKHSNGVAKQLEIEVGE